jgi:hypothetical protein
MTVTKRAHCLFVVRGRKPLPAAGERSRDVR